MFLCCKSMRKGLWDRTWANKRKSKVDNKDVTFETRMQTEYIYIYRCTTAQGWERYIYIYIFCYKGCTDYKKGSNEFKFQNLFWNGSKDASASLWSVSILYYHSRSLLFIEHWHIVRLLITIQHTDFTKFNLHKYCIASYPLCLTGWS